MTSMRSLNRNLNAIARRIIRDDIRGKDPDPLDLLALRDAADAIIERLAASREG
jgi:hypothetical protein